MVGVVAHQRREIKNATESPLSMGEKKLVAIVVSARYESGELALWAHSRSGIRWVTTGIWIEPGSQRFGSSPPHQAECRSAGILSEL